ncbi:hypothetical protein [Streptomyces sp. NRRL F-2580]|uniref:hypothetical protein n=1 Tax=Streptomyces sp. NRRL F-2580 TaxID=1463841 RepID=UPI000A8085E7|nr:hypothetical protein [Streptomyces sp. NRRL F-2580]
MTTTTMRLAPVIGGQRRGGEMVPPDWEPIYAALVQEWLNAGRRVPGRHDEEWAILARRCPRPQP